MNDSATTLGRWRETIPNLAPNAKVRWVAPQRTGIQTWVGFVGERKVATIKRQPGHIGAACTALIEGWVWDMVGVPNPLNVREGVARSFESVPAAKRAIAEAIRRHPPCED